MMYGSVAGMEVAWNIISFQNLDKPLGRDRLL